MTGINFEQISARRSKLNMQFFTKRSNRRCYQQTIHEFKSEIMCITYAVKLRLSDFTIILELYSVRGAN